MQSYPATLVGVLWQRYLAGHPSTDQLASLLDGCAPRHTQIAHVASIEISRRENARIVHAISVLAHPQSQDKARDWAAGLILDQSKNPEHLTLALRANSGNIRACVGRAMLAAHGWLAPEELFAIMDRQIRQYHQDVIDAAAERALSDSSSAVSLAGVVMYASDPLKEKAILQLGAIKMDDILELLEAEARKE